MTRVDFYIVESGKRDVLRVACRLAEKAYLEKQRVCVRAASPQQAAQLDRLMWLFRDGSFVPHGLVEGATAGAGEPVLITCGDTDQVDSEMLINLAETPPRQPERFARVAELVDNTEAAKASGRERFRQYREQGYSLNTHKV